MYPFCTLVAKCESDAEFMMMSSSLNKTFQFIFFFQICITFLLITRNHGRCERWPCCVTKCQSIDTFIKT